jgi:hypothetical protein
MLSPTGSNGGKHPDATLAEYCEYWGDSESVAQPQHDVPGFAKRTTHAKKTRRRSQCATARVQTLRCEYWQQIKTIEPKTWCSWIRLASNWG